MGNENTTEILFEVQKPLLEQGQSSVFRDKKGRFIKGRLLSIGMEQKRIEGIRISYIEGKHKKPMWKHTKEWKNKMSQRMKGNKWGFKKGHKLLGETETKRIENLKKSLGGNIEKNLGEYSKKGHTPWNKGKILSEEIKTKISQSKKGSQSPMLGKKHTEKAKQIIREKRWRQVIPVKNTIPEKLLSQKLIEEKISFEKHKPIKGQPDIFIKPNICVFVDGDYFHGNPNIYSEQKLSKIQTKNKKNDNEVNLYLKENNYIVLRFWEKEIKNSIDTCIQKIKNTIRSRSQVSVSLGESVQSCPLLLNDTFYNHKSNQHI